MCWASSKDGVLRVKDVYSLAMKDLDGASCSSGPDPLWKQLWNLKVPPKVSEFLWRAYWDIVPHDVNLAKKGISKFVRCSRCGGDESLMHILKDCPWAHEVWAVANISIPMGVVSSFRDWFEFVWNSKGSGVSEKMATICWQIWKCKNDRIFEKVNSPPLLCVGKAREWLREYHEALSFALPSSIQPCEKGHWCSPPFGVIKINYDGACDRDGDNMGVGVVARDHSGRFLWARNL